MRLTKRDKEIIEEMNFTRDLLAEFDSLLLGMDPGVLATSPNSLFFSMSFSGTEWEWLRPLLVELRGHRRQHPGQVA